MPALAHTKPWLVSLMIRSPRRRRMRTDSRSTSGLWRQRVVGIDGHEAVLGLRHDLLGDHDDVAVGERGVGAGSGGVGDDPGQVVPGRDLADAVEAEDGEPAHRLGLHAHGAQRGAGEGGGRLGAAHDRRRHHAAHALGLDRGGPVGVGLVDHQGRRRASA